MKKNRFIVTSIKTDIIEPGNKIFNKKERFSIEITPADNQDPSELFDMEKLVGKNIAIMMREYE